MAKAPSFRYLQMILQCPRPYLFGDPPLGERQYYGPHFLALVSYALKLAPKNNLVTFSDALTNLTEAACRCWCFPAMTEAQKLLNLMVSFLTKIRTEIGELFITSKKVDIIASFIEFLVDALEKLSSCSFSWIIVSNEINILCKRLKFLLFFLRDTPFRCTETEESKNILAEIESINNEVGIFLYSFFFTTDRVTITEMDLQLSIVLSKLEVVEEKIKEHCLTVVEQPKFTSQNLTSASIYIVDSLLDDLNHLLNHNADIIVEVKDQIKTLHEKLYSSRSMLKDAKLQLNKELERYEMQLIDLAYQAEYTVVCFVAGEVPTWYLSLRLHTLIQESNPIWASLTELKLNSSIRGVRVTESWGEVSSSQVATKSIPMVDEIIVGFKETKRQIANQLFGGPKNLQIISIIGMGGLGKTTLARYMYNHPDALLHFDKRCWYVVSQSYQKSKLLIEILSSISNLKKDELSEMEDHQLAERIYKSLKGTRYLLVADDIWKKEAWDDFKRYFPDDVNGSRIMFTSRNKDVSLQASSKPVIHDLPLLSSNECWDLLQKKVFPNSIFPRELEDIGKEIAKNCKGLPLVVVGIAAILANMDKKESLWQEVATNLTSYVCKDRDILELSYQHLPLHLKPCFLHLGGFKEDEEISVKELLSLWVSEGLIPKHEYKISEDVAKDYLLELINRSMVQVAKRRSENGVKACTIHDLMRDMCLRLGDKENFFKVINKKSSTYEQHHHICIHSHSYDFSSRPFGLHIRSLFCDFEDLSPITSSMKRLRVLKLSNHVIVYGTTLEFLVQLRHLECAGTISNFTSHMNLEFLSVEGSLIRKTQLTMPKLRHLHLGKSSLYLPFDWLDISQTKNLQNLSGILIQNSEDEERLRCLSQLRCLKCKYGESWEENSPDLVSLTQLISLYIGCTLLIKLKVINFPTHIKKLSISLMVLNCGLLSSIGTLPHLEVLKLLNVEFEEWRWNTNGDEFQTLKFLKLESVTLDEWNTSEDHFPVLEKLLLRECSDLKLLPSDLGYIPTLQMIEVLYCTEDVRNCAKNIEEEQEQEGNEQLKVIISGAYEDS